MRSGLCHVCLEECQDPSIWHFGTQEEKVDEEAPLGILLTTEEPYFIAREAVTLHTLLSGSPCATRE